MSPKTLDGVYDDELSLSFTARLFFSSSVYTVPVLFLCFSGACLNALSIYGAPRHQSDLGQVSCTCPKHLFPGFVPQILSESVGNFIAEDLENC